jgi:hypothetical protein
MTACATVRGAVIVEPDNFADKSVLTNAVAGVTLYTAGADNAVEPFNVTSDVRSGLASTGTEVFGNADVPFWWTQYRLRMQFSVPVTSVSIDAVGGSFFAHEVGRLEVYDTHDNLLAAYRTANLGYQQVETMTESRPAGDIAYAIAYAVPGPEGSGPFTSLDHLVFTPVPEAGTLVVGVIGVVWMMGRRRNCR